MKKWLKPSTMHSNVETLSRPTASPKRAPSFSIRSSVPRSPSRISRVLPLASAISVSSSSRVSDTSTSFCSCICTEQSRPPSETHQRPLPISWISLWRVLSRFSSIRKFRFEPAGSTFDSASTSITAAAHLLRARDDALALPAAAADVLEADPVARVLAPDRAALELGLRLELLDRDQLDELRVAGLEQRLGVLLELARAVPREREPVLGREPLERAAVASRARSSARALTCRRPGSPSCRARARASSPRPWRRPAAPRATTGP